MTHVYLYNSGNAQFRARRYVPLQLEYYKDTFHSEATAEFMRGGLTAWEYTEAHLPHWKDTIGLKDVHYVRGVVALPAAGG
jgi:hypothetical protein